jgi:hypothetical protein
LIFPFGILGLSIALLRQSYARTHSLRRHRSHANYVFYSLRDADTESQLLTPRPKLKRYRLEGCEIDQTEEQPELKRQLIKPFDFAHIKAVETPPPPTELPKVEPDLEVAPSESGKRKSVSESIRRGPSTVAELLEQERAVRARIRKRSTSSTTSVETPTRGERVDREIIQKRRLLIRNMPSWTLKRDVVSLQLHRLPADQGMAMSVRKALKDLSAPFKPRWALNRPLPGPYKCSTFPYEPS